MLLQLNRIDDATRQYQLAVRTGPKGLASRSAREIGAALSEFHLRNSNAAYNQGRWEEALASAREAIDLSAGPELTAQARNQFAWILCDKLNRDLDQAEKEIRLALEARPDEAAFLDTYAWTLFKLRRYDEALDQQLLALRKKGLRPDGPMGDSEYYYHLGSIQEALKDLGPAIESYQRAADSGGASRHPFRHVKLCGDWKRKGSPVDADYGITRRTAPACSNRMVSR